MFPSMTPIHSFFLAIADAIVGEPGLVTVSSAPSRNQLILKAVFPAEHHGKAIGQGGATIDGLRLMVALAGRRFGVEPSLRLQSPEQRFSGEVVPFTPNLRWDCRWLTELVQRIADSCFLKPVAVAVTDRSDGTTTVQFRLAATEPSTLPDEQVQSAFRAVFKVIGMANGRKLHLELKRA